MNLYIWTKAFLIFLLLGSSSACTSRIKKSDLIKTKVFKYPVLKGKTDNLVLRVSIENTSKDILAQSFGISLGKSNTESIKTIRLFYTGHDSVFIDEMVYGTLESVLENHVIIEGSQLLKNGQNFFWVSFELNDNVDLLSTVSANIEFVQLGDSKVAPNKEVEFGELRLGVAVRKHWDDSVHTYRIPGLATTNAGTLLAIYDVRRKAGRDLQGDIDIGVSRSIDGGNIWEPMRIALDMGEWSGLPQKFNGVSDANILVDRNSNAIYIAGLWMHGVINADGIWQEGLNEDSRDWNHQWRNKGSQPGMGVKQTSQFLISKSINDGKTWSKPVNITRMCKVTGWWLFAPAPGHGITLSDGTLVFPTQGRDENGLPFSNITYSKDGGKTWKTSNPGSHNTTESMAVELSDGSVMLNIRDNRNRKEKGEKNGRAIMVTSDMGESWTEHETSHRALIECVCMASIHKHSYMNKNGNKKSVLFFSNPNSKSQRHKQTVKVSFDDGKTWPEKYWIELDEGRGAGYSCLTSIDENTIGILYEGSQAQMTFQNLSIKNLLK